MALKKQAFSGRMSIEPLNQPQGWDIFNLPKQIKTASIDKFKDNGLGGFDLNSEVEKHPEHLYLKIFAIKQDEVNDNGDAFSKDQLKKASHTFIGVPIFTNHQHEDIEKAKGECVHSWYDDNAEGIFILAKVDKIAYPRLARGIEEGYISGTSMGCSVEHSICSVCHNKAATADDYCTHVKESKNRARNGSYNCDYHGSSCKPQEDCPVCGCKLGETSSHQIKEQKAFEWNYGLKFIENSFVVNPACHSCGVTSVLHAPEVTKKVAELKIMTEKLASNFKEKQKELLGQSCSVKALHKAAQSDNNPKESLSCFMSNKSGTKIAGQQELDMLKQSMDHIEKVSKSMLAQKDHVDLEYVSDLVEAMQKLQGTVDELTEMGYAQLPSPPELGDVKMGEDMSDIDPIQSAQPMEPSIPPTAPQSGSHSKQDIMGGLGSITAPSHSASTNKKKDFITSSSNVLKSVMQLRDLSTKLAGSKGNESVANKITHVWQEGNDPQSYHVIIGPEFVTEAKGDDLIKASSIESLPQEIQNKLETEPETIASSILKSLEANGICDMTVIASNISTNSVKELNRTMADNVKKAQVSSDPGARPEQQEVITEKQLSKNPPELHGRQGEVFEQITESDEQLGRSDDKSNDTTSDSPQKRTGSYETITEDQLGKITSGVVAREKDAPEVITEKQWGDMSRLVSAQLPDDWTETITEDQLRSLLSSHRFVGTYEVITEGQMKAQPTGVKRWANKAYTQSLTKVAIASLSDAIATYRKSPEQIRNVVASLEDDPSRMNKAAWLSVLNSLPHKRSDCKTIASSFEYFNKTASQQDNMSTFDVLVLSVAKNAKAGQKAEDVFETIAHAMRQRTIMSKVDNIVKVKLANIQEETQEVGKYAALNDAFESLDGFEIRATVKDIKADPKDKKAFTIAARKFAVEQIGHNDIRLASIKIAQDSGLVQLLIEALQDVAAEISGDENGFGNEDNFDNEDNFEDDVTFEIIEDIDPINGDCLEKEDTTPFETEIDENINEEEEEDKECDGGRGGARRGDRKGLRDGHGDGLGREKEEVSDISMVASKEVNQEKRANTRKDMVKEAQMLGGEQGGQAGAAQQPGAGATLPQPPGMDQNPVESFDAGFEEGEIETDTQPKPPGSICCVCGSDDVDVISGDWKCNNCGSNGIIKISIEVKKWADLTGDNEGEEDDEFGGEGFEMPDEAGLEPGGGMPELPVAAMTKLTPNALKKLAENDIEIGSVSPLTGSTNTVKIASGKFVCLDTGIPYSVAFAVSKEASVNNKALAYAQWNWTPKTASVCPTCSRTRKTFIKALVSAGISEDQFNSMTIPQKAKKIIELKNAGQLTNLKTASKNGSVLEDYKKAYASYDGSFPIESCREKLARRYGKNALALSGPCEGHPIHECVCDQLKNAGIYSDQIAIKIAGSWADRDGTEECMEDLVRLDLSIREAAVACSALKTAFAEDTDFLADSFGNDEDDFEGPDEGPDGPPLDIDDGGMDEDPFEEEVGGTVTLELSSELAEQLDAELDVALGESPAEEEHHDSDIITETPIDDIEPEFNEETAVIEGDEVGGPKELGLDKPMIGGDVLAQVEKEEGVPTKVAEVDDTKTVASAEDVLEQELDAAALFNQRVGGVGKMAGLNYDSLAEAIGMTKTSAEKEIKRERVQESPDIGTVSAGDPLSGNSSSLQGHENETIPDADHPKVPRSDARIGHEDENIDKDETLPVIPSDKGTIGHEDEVGLSGGDVRFTGGDSSDGGSPGAGQADVDETTASEDGEVLTADQEHELGLMRGIAGNSDERMNYLVDRIAKKLEAPKPVSEDEDIQPISDGKSIGHEPKFTADKPENTEGTGNEAMQGHEKETLESVPKYPKDLPDIPADNALMGHEGDADIDPEKQTREKGTVIASSDEESQVNSQNEAFRVAGRMLEVGIIQASQLQTKVAELAVYTPDLIRNYEKAAFANSNGKKGLGAVSDGLERPIIINEASSQRDGSVELTSKLQSLFALDEQNKQAETLPDFSIRQAYKG